MKLNQDAAIAAIATAPAPGAVGIIRISGRDSEIIADRLFFPKSGGKLADRPARSAVFGEIRGESGEVLDNALAIFFPGPASYTGEDTVELQCHGGPALLQTVLDRVLDCGARMAGPGEFTRRAFLNGKMDLTQAEAVADLISADWEGAVKNAAAQLSGAYGARIRSVYESLRSVAAAYTAVMDYSDQNVSAPDTDGAAAELAAAGKTLCELVRGASSGQILRDGLHTAVVGRPNAGKSSVFNRLLGFSRSIVTDEAGTTRDVVTEKVCVGGVPLRLADTAGLREGTTAPERMGIALARSEADRAGLILAVFDVSAPLTEEDEEVLSLAGENIICLCNKCDLTVDNTTKTRLENTFKTCISVSAVTGEGFDALAAAVTRAAGFSGVRFDGSLVTNARQRDMLSRAEELVRDALTALELGAEDALWGCVTEACEAVGSVLGIAVPEDVEKEVFSRFCIGK